LFSASWHILPFVIIKEKLAHPMQEGQVLFISPYIWYLVQCSVVISCGTCPCVKKLLKSFFCYNSVLDVYFTSCSVQYSYYKVYVTITVLHIRWS
jgi:hypothetical protein